MKPVEIYRLIAADHFEMLSSDEQKQLAAALHEHPEIDREAFVSELRARLQGDAAADQDRAFLDAIAAAEAELAGADDEVVDSPSPGGGGRQPRRAAFGWWRTLAAAVAGALVVFVAGQLREAPPSDTAAPATDLAGQPVFLDATRSEASQVIDLGASSATEPHPVCRGPHLGAGGALGAALPRDPGRPLRYDRLPAIDLDAAILRRASAEGLTARWHLLAGAARQRRNAIRQWPLSML